MDVDESNAANVTDMLLDIVTSTDGERITAVELTNIVDTIEKITAVSGLPIYEVYMYKDLYIVKTMTTTAALASNQFT